MKSYIFSIASLAIVAMTSTLSFTSCADDTTIKPNIPVHVINKEEVKAVSADVHQGLWVNDDIVKYFDITAEYEENGKVVTTGISDHRRENINGEVIMTHFVGYKNDNVSLPVNKKITFHFALKQGINTPATMNTLIRHEKSGGSFKFSDGTTMPIKSGTMSVSSTGIVPFTKALALVESFNNYESNLNLESEKRF